MVEEFRLDPTTKSWDAHNPRADSLDTVANAEPGQLLPWETFFDLTYDDFAHLNPKPAMSLPLTWRLGLRGQKSEMQMFYAQAGAACAYLFQLSSRSREALGGYLAAWYGGDRVQTDVRWSFKAAPDVLGERIVEFARRRVGE